MKLNQTKTWFKMGLLNLFFSSPRQASTKNFLTSIVAILLAVAFSVGLAGITDTNHPEFFGLFGDLFSGWAKTSFSISETMYRTTVLALAGLSFIVAFKCGIFNIGISGQMLFSGMVVFLIANQLGSSVAFGGGQILMVLIAILAGGFIAFLTSIIRNIFNVHEVVGSIIINWIILYLVNYLGKTFLPLSASQDRTAQIGSNYSLFTSTFGLHDWWAPGFIILIIACVSVFILFRYTVLGKKMISISQSIDGSRYAGYKIKIHQNNSLILSGMIAGLLGLVVYTGYSFDRSISVTSTVPPVEGFNGIAIALIALNSPIWVIAVGFILSLLNVSSLNSLMIEQTNPFASLTLGIVMFLVAIFNLFLYIKPWKSLVQLYVSDKNIRTYESFSSKTELLVLETREKMQEAWKSRYLFLFKEKIFNIKLWKDKKLFNFKNHKIAKPISENEYKNLFRNIDKDFNFQYTKIKNQFYKDLTVNLFAKYNSKELINWKFKLQNFKFYFQSKFNIKLTERKLYKVTAHVLKEKQRSHILEKDIDLSSYIKQINDLTLKLKKTKHDFEDFKAKKINQMMLQKANQKTIKHNSKEFINWKFKLQNFKSYFKAKLNIKLIGLELYKVGGELSRAKIQVLKQKQKPHLSKKNIDLSSDIKQINDLTSKLKKTKHDFEDFKVKKIDQMMLQKVNQKSIKYKWFKKQYFFFKKRTKLIEKENAK